MKARHIIAICVSLFLAYGCSDNGIMNPLVDEEAQIESIDRIQEEPTTDFGLNDPGSRDKNSHNDTVDSGGSQQGG